MKRCYEFITQNGKSTFSLQDLLFISKKDDTEDVIEIGLVGSDITIELYYESEKARNEEFDKLIFYVSESHYLFQDQGKHLILKDNIIGIEFSDSSCLDLYFKNYESGLCLFYDTDKESWDDYHKFVGHSFKVNTK